jgi:hypothetical protein
MDQMSKGVSNILTSIIGKAAYETKSSVLNNEKVMAWELGAVVTFVILAILTYMTTGVFRLIFGIPALIAIVGILYWFGMLKPQLLGRNPQI